MVKMQKNCKYVKISIKIAPVRERKSNIYFLYVVGQIFV